MKSGYAIYRRCEKYSRDIILKCCSTAEQFADKERGRKETTLKIHAKPIVKNQFVDIESILDEPVTEEDEELKLPVLFDGDGFTHRRCPVSEATPEILNIIADTLYCIDTNTLSDDGGAMDQSNVFRVAYTVLLHEREKIKNEREKAALDASKKNSKSNKPSRKR